MAKPITPAGPAIAIVGMACEFPGAHSPEELWRNVLAGRRYFRKAPKERLPPEYFDSDPATPDKSYCDEMAVITGWKFDPLEFRVPPVTYAVTDIAHWCALFVARAAFRDAGVNLEKADRTRIGVVLGNTLTGEYSRSHNLRLRSPYATRALRRTLDRTDLSKEQREALLASFQAAYEQPLPAATEDTLAGNMANTIAGRICGHFDLGAGGYIVDGACSSSLLSIAHACRALASWEMDCALAGGVDISLDPFEIVGFAKAQALARDDIRPYDRRAAGMLAGEGCGLFVLMREEDARTAGLRIHALIRGWGISSDGAGGITAPEVEGQLRALRAAYDRAGYPISTVGLIEGHGTGTTLGDKVEITALRRLFDDGPATEVCRIGSIKSQIGHCKAAAGSAGVIKAVMALQRKILPPTANCGDPSPIFGPSPARLRPCLEGRAWEAGNSPRRASVSSMGFGGANSHVTLEEANPVGLAAAEDLSIVGSAQSSEIIFLSAPTREELRARIERLVPVARRICRAELTDLAAALAKACQPGKFRCAIVTESPWQLADALEQAARHLTGGGTLPFDVSPGLIIGEALAAPQWVALFPGQGSQRLNMGDFLRRRYPFVRELFEQAGDELAGSIFRDVQAADPEQIKTWEAELRRTEIAQPAIVLSSLAMLRTLEFFGLTPSVSLGHSLGEISALQAAGSIDAPTAVRIAAARGQAMGSLSAADGGAMLAIAATPEEVQRLIDANGTAVVISNYNSPRQTVVSGASAGIALLSRACADRNLRCQKLPVSHAFHSDIVAPAADAFRAALAPIAFGSMTRTIVSSSSAEVLSAQTDLKELLGRQIRQPVRFTEAVRRVALQRPALWVEVGPGGVLTGLVRDILAKDAVEALPTDVAGEDNFRRLNEILARAFVLGLPVRTERVFAHRFFRPFDPENYDPVFIVNPCERPVEPVSSVRLGLGTFSEGLLPSGIDEATAAEYIGRRGAFLREMIEVDFRHQSAGGMPPASSPAPGGARPTPRPLGASGLETNSSLAPVASDALLAFAVDWIAKRTGFPKEVISADKKLRDDLNLDSIKVGELVIQLSRETKIPVTGDPARLANATLGEVVAAILVDRGPTTAPTPAPDARKIAFELVSGLGESVRTFEMRSLPAPIDSEAPRSFPDSDAVLLIAGERSPHLPAIADMLRKRGLRPILANEEQLAEADARTKECTTILIIVPDHQNSFFECTPEEFVARTERDAAQLFRIFQAVLAYRPADAKALRGLVLRPVAGAADHAPDSEAGAAFIKSALLEYPDSEIKWVTFPISWSPAMWAEMVEREFQVFDRIAVAYDESGRRTSIFASPVRFNPSSPERPLGTPDVVLVSGGAKGITFELALELARTTGAALGLLGSSPVTSPADGQSEDEMLKNFGRLEAEGIRYAYARADVTDLKAVEAAARKIEERLGAITGILHGAGVTRLRGLRDKPLDEYLDCIRIKTRGLYNLLSAVPRHGLKILHVISSVLGNSGMRGQVDYTFANAWLDGAVREFKTGYPQCHCLSLGYSVWAGTGLGRKIGALESLRAVGVTPIEIEEGIAAYRELLVRPQEGTHFIITGRLTTELEANLYPRPPAERDRFLDQVRRWVPGAEIIADATLSHRTDLYLPEHVLDGTPLFPGVMAIEAMVQAATACAGWNDMPVLRNIEFRRPLIVPEGGTIVIRTLASVEAAETGTLCVRAAMRSSWDDFQQNHFEAECWFGLPEPAAEGVPSCPSMSEPIDQNPEDFSPWPLFQGKFFRRITAIRKLESNREGWTEVLVPIGERYFSEEFPQSTVSLSPAARDAFLQSGALVVPPGSLPEKVDEWRIFRRWQPGERLQCFVRVRPEGDRVFNGDIEIRDAIGEMVERISGAIFRRSSVVPGVVKITLPAPIPMNRISADIASRFADVPHAFEVVAHDVVAGGNEREEVTSDEIFVLAQETTMTRLASAVANLIAARRAAVDCAARYLALKLSSRDVQLAHRPDGKPELQFADATQGNGFQALDISLADGGGWSIAFIGPTPVGVDIEAIETRDCETWRDLLGVDGYALALRIGQETREVFDLAATRVWTLLEAGKKAFSLRRILPQSVESSVGDGWLTMSIDAEGGARRFLSALLKKSDAAGPAFAIGITFGSEVTVESKREIPTEFHFDKFKFGLRADYSGPQGELVLTKRFPVLFRDCQSPSKKVPFTRYASWMGDLREDSSLSIFPDMIRLFGTETWGVATNHYRLEVLGEISPGDTVEGKLWGAASPYDHLWLLKFEWRATAPSGKTMRVARSEMGFSWVKILAHGIAKVEAMPKVLKEFFKKMLPEMDALVRPLEPLPWGYEFFHLGPQLWQQTSLADTKSALFSHEILTTSENSNWVGNIYFANYGEWMGRVRDLYFHPLTPNSFRNAGRDGEWICLSCVIDHLSEAMPFDRILITMNAAAVYASGVDLTFNYFLLENGQLSRKLAHGKHTMAWVGRDGRDLPVALELPRNVKQALIGN